MDYPKGGAIKNSGVAEFFCPHHPPHHHSHQLILSCPFSPPIEPWGGAREGLLPLLAEKKKKKKTSPQYLLHGSLILEDGD